MLYFLLLKSNFYLHFWNKFDPGVSFDIHAHSLATGAFMYGNVVDEQHQNEQQTLPRIFSAHAEDFSLSRTNFNKDAVSYFILIVISFFSFIWLKIYAGESRNGSTSLGWIISQKLYPWSLILSLSERIEKRSLHGKELQVNNCNQKKKFNFQLRKLGENLARSLVEYYRLHPPI